MTQGFPCGDLPHTGQQLVFKKEDIRKAAEHLASLAAGEGVLHEKRAHIPLQDVYEDLELKLEKPLARGCTKLAQVWLSSLLIDGHRHPVVVKLYMGRYSDCEKWTPTSTRTDFEYSDKAPPELFAFVERDAYAMLSSAQGSIVPWSYGTYQFEMPWSESCYGIILEYITGKDPVEYAMTLAAGSEKAVDAFHVNCFKTFVEIHNRDVFHGDIHSANIKLLEPVQPLDPHFVTFDFNLSGCISDFVKRGIFWEDGERTDLLDMLSLCGFDWWFEKGDNSVWISRFDRIDRSVKLTMESFND